MLIIIPNSVHVHTRSHPVFLVGVKLSTLHVCYASMMHFHFRGGQSFFGMNNDRRGAKPVCCRHNHLAGRFLR